MSMPSCKRWIRWTAVAALVAGVGVGAYRLTPPKPMCTIEGRKGWHTLLAGGRKLAAIPMRFDNQTTAGPLQAWDTRTGKHLTRHFDKPDDQSLHYPRFSPDGRVFVAEKAIGERHNWIEHSLQMIDLETGNAQNVPVEGAGIGYFEFSPSEELVVRRQGDREGWGLQVFETAGGHLIGTFPKASYHRFSAEALYYSTRTMERRTDLGIWSIRKRSTVATIQDIDSNPDVASTIDGQIAVFLRPKRADQPRRKFVVWDCRAEKIEAEFESEMVRTLWPLLSDDGRWLARHLAENLDGRLEIRDLPSGKQHGTYRSHPLENMMFSPDGRSLAMLSRAPGQTLEMLDVSTLSARWKFTTRQNAICFSGDSRQVFSCSIEAPEVLVRDCATGEVLERIPVAAQCDDHPPGLMLTKNRAHLLIRQHAGLRSAWFDEIVWLRRLWPSTNDVVIVYDINGKVERFRLERWDVTNAHLSDDGNTLLTIHDQDDRRRYRCWDVTARKPLRWAIGVPAGLGTLVVLFTWWRRSRASAKP